MKIEKPIELLRAASRSRYLEAHCAELLRKANYDLLLVNCRYLQAFDKEFAARLPAA